MTLGKRFVALVVTAVGIVIVAVALATVGNSPAGAAPGAAPVVVTNTAADPVQTAVVGTPTVNVGNTPAVNVANTPTVRIDGSAPIAVRIDTGTPVTRGIPIEVLDGADRQEGAIYDVPAGQRLLIEQVSCVVSLPAGQIPLIEVRANDDANFWFPLTFGGTDAFGDSYVGTQLARQPIDGPRTVRVTVHRRVTNGSAFALCNIAGQLTDVQ